MYKFLWIAFCSLGTIASLISVWFGYSQNPMILTISFHVFLVCMFLAYVSFKCYEFGFFSKEKFQTLHSHVRWIWNEDGSSTYEMIRVVKCRALYIVTHKFNHVWSGRGKVSLDSEITDVTLSCNGPDLCVNYPLSFWHGEIRTIHYTLELCDNEKKQTPYIYLKAKHEIGAAVLEVILKGVSKSDPATVCIGEDGQVEEQGNFVKNVNFDCQLHSFRYSRFNIPKGLQLWLRWPESRIDS